MTLPNFLVIGAGKAGTTALYHYLGQHPQVYVTPTKETNFFALEGEKVGFRGPGVEERINSWTITELGEYEEQFAGVQGEAALGETCPLYLYSRRAPQRIHAHVPEAKLIAVLRDPSERAYSAFTHLVRDNREVPDFARALELEDERVRENYPWIFHYRRMGYYHEQLSRYYELFDADQIRVYLYEDLESDAVDTLRDMYRFLEVDDTFAPDTSARHNASGVPRNRLVNEFLRRRNPLKSALRPLLPAGLRRKVRSNIRRRNIAHAPPLPPEVRARLVEAYREEIERLQGLIGRDLSGWLEP